MNPLDNYLRKNKISGSAFARTAHLSQPTVWRIRHGKVKQISPRTATCVEVATGGEVTALELLYPRKRRNRKEQGETAAVRT